MSRTDYRPRRARVVIGFAESLAAPEVVSSLAGAGFEVVAFSRAGHRCAVRYDRRVTVVDVPAPETSVAATLDALARLFETADIVMPLDDAAVFLVDEVTRDTKVPVAGPTGNQARVALDKRVQIGLATAAGLPVAAWTDIDLGAGLPEGWAPPFMLKPALASEIHEGALRRLSPRRVDSLDELAELRYAWGDDADVFAQTLVSGIGEGVFGLATPAGVHHLSAHQRIRMMNPAGSGSSACHSIPVTDDLVGPVRAFLRSAAWQGMFMVELLRDPDGTPWFMELNGRPWGSLALARRLGFEYPAWAVEQVLDPSAVLPDAPEFRELTARHLGREILHLAFVMRGPKGAPAQPWPTRGQTMRALLRRTPNTAWYNWSPSNKRVFFADTLFTVRDALRD